MIYQYLISVTKLLVPSLLEKHRILYVFKDIVNYNKFKILKYPYYINVRPRNHRDLESKV